MQSIPKKKHLMLRVFVVVVVKFGDSDISYQLTPS